ncbi:MAG: erythromycin esterase family protein [Candidatus Pseudobacter hemicellulosilyticus]|uniref:Erythromycin esterase family protein n=1 Tax=Candidatus Pseudobacter hemicellulosilyticus TaxID=3121375 RepID=A0AAJ5WPG9_9BACT|nr:MAG: erythromycin esterase family protein [Pseudobacter sp.]
MKKIYLSFLLIILFSNIIDGQQLREQDIQKITKSSKSHRIIGLGEEEHFFYGSNSNRIEIIKELIRKRLVQSIVFEYPGLNAFFINEYIHNRLNKADLLSSLRKFKPLDAGPFFDSKEMLSFIDWVKEKNRTGNDIDILGMDFYNYSTAVEILQSTQIADKNKITLDSIRHSFDTLTYYLKTSPSSLVKEETRRLAEENFGKVKTLLSTIDTASSVSIRHVTRDLYDYAYLFTSLNSRDSVLFRNFRRIDNEKKTFLIWAANFHIQNDSLNMPIHSVSLFGNLMAKQYKEQYYKIGVLGSNPCKQTNDHRVLIPDASCSIKAKLDLIVIIEKGDRTTSILNNQEMPF